MAHYNCHDNLVQLEDFIDSNIYQDAPNVNSSNNTPPDDWWQYEYLPGSQAESPPHPHQDHQDYLQLARQSLTGSPSAPSSWPGGQPSAHASIGQDGHEPEYPSYFSAFSSGTREFGWAEYGGSEQYLNPIGEQATLYPQSQFPEGYSMAPTDSSYSLAFPNSEQSNTPSLSQCEMTAEDERLLTEAAQNSTAGVSTFGYVYEPAPSNVARPSLFSEWIDPSPQSCQALLGARPPVTSQHSFMEPDRRMSQAIETSDSLESSLLYASACNGSPIDTGSLPDLSCSRRQTPGSGPMDVTRTERPMTPYASSGKHQYTSYEHSDHQPTGPSGTWNHRFSFSGNATFMPSTEPSSSRSSSYETSAESYSHLPEGSRTLSLDSRRPLCNIVSTISIPSPPQLFANTPISRTNSYANSSSLRFPALLPPVMDAHPQARPKQNESSAGATNSAKGSKRSSTSSKTDRPKRKRMHICNLCGKDFNRPSALLLHATVHTGERSNFCNVCGRSFSNLSNLRRHQRQLHVLESQMPLPEIPGPASELDAYNFGSQTRF